MSDELVSPVREGPNGAWKNVLHLARRQFFPKGHPLLPDEASVRDFYYIERGRVRIIYASQEGRERSMLVVESGNLFNESSALTGYDNPDSQYLCLEDSILWRFSGTLLGDPSFVREHPDLIINLMRSLARKTLSMHEHLSYTGTGRTEVQLARYLIRSMESHGAATFPPGLTQQELADTLGIHRATLVRCVHTLRARGVLGAFTRKRVEILDPPALHILAGQ